MTEKRPRKSDAAEDMRQSLKASFLRLYAHQPLTRISIQQIADGAGVSRGSFYYHYSDVFHLLEELENDLVNGINSAVRKEELLQTVRARGEGLSPPSLAPYLYLPLLNYLEANRETILILDGGSHNRTFADKLQSTTRDNLLHAFHRSFSPGDSAQRKYMAEYMAAGCVATYMKWLQGGMQEPKELLAEVIMDAMSKLITPPPGSR